MSSLQPSFEYPRPRPRTRNARNNSHRQREAGGGGAEEHDGDQVEERDQVRRRVNSSISRGRTVSLKRG
jgi:hypothetical protein